LFLTHALAMTAVRTAIVPMVEEMMERRLVKRPHLALVVARRDGLDYTLVYDYNFGDVHEWEHDFDAIARAKTVITARTGLPTRVVQELHPELLLPTDTQFWGNWVEGNIIVSCSGVEPWFDEAISKSAVAIIKAMIDHARRHAAEAHQDANTYDGSDLHESLHAKD